MRHSHTLVMLAVALGLFSRAEAATLSGRTSSIFGAAIAAVPYEVRDQGGVLWSAPGSVTSGVGDFSVTVPVGRYDVTFAPPLAAHVFGAVRNGVRVDVSTTLNVQLAPGKLLTGRILTPAGAAVAHVALQFADPLFLTPPANVANAVTDEAGNVSVLVSPGTWRVSGEPRLDQGIAPRILGTFDLVVDRSLGVVPMLPGFVVTGRIVDPAGTPLESAEFYVQNPATGAELYTPTDLTNAVGVAQFVVPAGIYDMIGVPPLGPVFAARALRRVVVDGPVNLGDVTLPAGANLFARLVTSGGAPVAGVDCLVDSLPSLRRLALVNPTSDAVGNVSAVVTPGSLRVAFAPAVATRLLPAVFDPLAVSGATDLGTVVLRDGHWVQFSVREAGTGAPIAGAILDFVDPVTGRTALTLGDTTDAAGRARVTTDQAAYQLVVRSPLATWNNATVQGFRTLADTAVVVQLVNPSVVLPAVVSVGAAPGSISTCSPKQTLPVTLSRTTTEFIKAWSVTVQLSPELIASGGAAAFVDANFFPNPTFHVTDRGNGLYTVDNAELTLVPCGVATTNSKLFDIVLTGGVPAGTGKVAITDVKLRDCANIAMAASAGAAGTVRIAAPLLLSEAHADVACFGASTGSIDLTVGGGTAPYAYVWSNAATTQDLSRLAAGSYSVTVTDADGCSSSLSVSLVQPAAALALSETHTPTCNGSPDGSIDLTVGGGTAPYAYLWSNGSVTQDVSALVAGTFSVTVTDAAGCTAGLSVAIVVRSYTITASAGTGGSITPSGAVAVACGDASTFAIAADAGFHVASIFLDGTYIGASASVTLSNVTASHVLSVAFAANGPVAPITDLTAVQVRKGNDTDGTTRITLSWGAVAAGSTVEVWRAPYGNYPLYDDGPVPGQVPALPAAYPPVGWSLTAVSVPGDFDEPATRDVWYYVAWVTDAFGTRSPASNRTGGTLDYHLGDVSNGVAGSGDNSVNTLDLSLLGLHYGHGGAAIASVAYLDVGPTIDFTTVARPVTDRLLDFEDLVVFSINYNPAVSTPHALPSAASADELLLETPRAVAPGARVTARLRLRGTGRMLAASVKLAWDPAVVRPLGFAAGDLVTALGGVVFSPRLGTLDGAVMAAGGTGLVGDGEFAMIEFEVLTPGDPALRIESVDARDEHNARVPVSTALLPVVQQATAFASPSPNPFAGSTTLAFALSQRVFARLAVFSVDGRRVRTLLEGVQEPAEFRIAWDGRADDGRAMPPGVYYARLDAGTRKFTRTVTLLH